MIRNVSERYGDAVTFESVEEFEKACEETWAKVPSLRERTRDDGKREWFDASTGERVLEEC